MGAVTTAVKHSILRTISVVCVLMVIGGIGWGGWTIYRMATKSSVITTQKAEAITNNYQNPDPEKIAKLVDDLVDKRLKSLKRKWGLWLYLGGVEIGGGK